MCCEPDTVRSLIRNKGVRVVFLSTNFRNLTMAKAKKKTTPKKQRAETYDPKLSINGTLSDVIGVAMKPKKENKEEGK